jgi:hypothetical protein
MRAAAALALLCGAAACAPKPVCVEDEDCSLSGVCRAGTCACFRPWGGADCGELQFRPIQAPAETNGYPGASANATTWGGNAVLFDGQYHLFVAEMTNNCTLAQWGSNSRCVHAVASSAEGPYARVDVALPVWCESGARSRAFGLRAAGRARFYPHPPPPHPRALATAIGHNPQVSFVPGGGFGGADLWALWHIGGGNGAPDGGAHCAANGTVLSAALPPDAGGAPGSPVHVANSPFGPWTPVLTPQPSCNNPSQFRHPNGTWFIVCDSTALYRGENVTGPWVYVTQVTGGGTPGIEEDAFLYIDARGHWHNLKHAYSMDCRDPSCAPYAISAHSFSRDGLTWTGSCTQPFFNTANVSDGSVVTMSTRERPKLLFNAAGEPTHLFNVSSAGARRGARQRARVPPPPPPPVPPQGICPMPACAPQAAIQCKVQGITKPGTPGSNGPVGYWDHTLVVPLDV